MSIVLICGMADRRGFIGVLTGMAVAIFGSVRLRVAEPFKRVSLFQNKPELLVTVEGPNPADVIRDILVETTARAV